MRPEYKLSAPPGRKRERLLVETYYSPRRGQNLVASLTGWIDRDGRRRLAARSLPRDRVTLGPAQVSRLVFATPRVSNLLGLSNLEVRDLRKASLDSVTLGQPHLLFLPTGVVQIQSLFEGSRGAGAARLIGVTAFLNGRAGLGPNVQAAVRQALHEAPTLTVPRPRRPISVGRPAELEIVGSNVRRAVVTIASPAGEQRATVGMRAGRGTLRWVPRAAGSAHLRVDAVGVDGSRVTARAAIRVLSRPPSVQLIDPPERVVVGRPVRAWFSLRHGVGAVAEIAGRGGVEVTRRYRIGRGRGFVEWTPTTPGRVVFRVRARGHEAQVASRSAGIEVRRAPRVARAPSVTLVSVPRVATPGRASAIVFRAAGCVDADARIAGPRGTRSAWRFRCREHPLRLAWSPSGPGRYALTLSAHARGGARSQTSISLTARRAP
jgi:uncharacterized protein